MKKRIIVFAAILIFALPIIVVQAPPVWETFGMYPWVNYHVLGTGTHIASDPLFNSTTVNSIPPFHEDAADHVLGWVTFPCSSDKPLGEKLLTGFLFSVTVKGVPKGDYTIMAYPTTAFPPPPDLPYDSTDFGHDPYELGTFTVTGNLQRAQFHGVFDLEPGDYAWRITVELDGTPIAETHWIDAADFTVIS